jgi:hypothetical protein
MLACYDSRGGDAQGTMSSTRGQHVILLVILDVIRIVVK